MSLSFDTEYPATPAEAWDADDDIVNESWWSDESTVFLELKAGLEVDSLVLLKPDAVGYWFADEEDLLHKEDLGGMDLRVWLDQHDWPDDAKCPYGNGEFENFCVVTRLPRGKDPQKDSDTLLVHYSHVLAFSPSTRTDI